MDNLLQDSFFRLITSSVFGLIFGSFATALIYRMPRDIDWIKKRSHCTHCETNLGFLDLIPVFSYVFSGGKCRHCKTPYSPNYLITEILITISFVLCFLSFKDFYIATMMSLLAFSLIVLSAIDFEHYIIPDEINLFIFILGFVYGVYNQIPVTDLLIMAVIYFLIALLLRFIMFAWKKKEGLGFGDVKFFAAAGVFLTDIELLPVFLFISGVAGVLIAITWKLLGKGKLFPFGPALSASLFFCVAFPEVGEKFTFFIQDSLYNN